MSATIARSILALLALGAAAAASAQTQEADPSFDARVERPAYRPGAGPVVTLDAAHRNFHTMDGRYRPFAQLVAADGYRIESGTAPFTRRSLARTRILVIANAGSGNAAATGQPAFSEAECDSVAAWVRRGGALLLIADHSPFGRAAQSLASRFGVRMGEGWVFEPQPAAPFLTTQIVYSRENGRLGAHPILEGRDPAERVGTLKAFTGQSLTLPRGAAALMILHPEAHEARDAAALNAIAPLLRQGWSAETARSAGAAPVGGRVQGLAMRFGRGRVVILAEAAMLSAQVVRLPGEGGGRTFTMGMNQPGLDNRQFALNVMRWLSGRLD